MLLSRTSWTSSSNVRSRWPVTLWPCTLDRSRRAMSVSVSQSVNQSVSQSVNQSVNQSVSQSVSQSINRSIDRSIDRSVGRSVDRLRSTTKSVKISHTTSWSVSRSVSLCLSVCCLYKKTKNKKQKNMQIPSFSLKINWPPLFEQNSWQISKSICPPAHTLSILIL